MSSCYYCGQKISSGTGVRTDFPTGHSHGKSGGRTYWSRVTLCQKCASGWYRGMVGVSIFFGAIILVLFMIGANSKKEDQTNNLKKAYIRQHNTQVVSTDEAKSLTTNTSPQSETRLQDKNVTSLNRSDFNTVEQQTEATLTAESGEAGNSQTKQNSSPSKSSIVQAKDGYANLRSQPSTEITALKQIPNGTSVFILDQETNSSNQLWYKVEVNGQVGWIYSELLSNVEQPESSSSTGSRGLTRGVSTLTTSDSKARINVRSKPTINARSLHYGLPGDKVTVIQCVQDQDTAGSDLNWCNVEFVQSKATGWVRSDFIISADGGN